MHERKLKEEEALITSETTDGVVDHKSSSSVVNKEDSEEKALDTIVTFQFIVGILATTVLLMETATSQTTDEFGHVETTFNTYGIIISLVPFFFTFFVWAAARVLINISNKLSVIINKM